MNAPDAVDGDDDALALGWLDRLLGVPLRERATLLEALRQRADLHSRVLRLLAAAEDDANSHVVQIPDAMTAEFPRVGHGLMEGMVLGGYRLIHEIEKGGMSHVWLAERSEGPLVRKVALKLPMVVLDDSTVWRFEQERDLLARLDHPGIARLIDAAVGEKGQPFFVMEYIDGLRLDAACNTRRLGLRERLLMFQQVLLAVEHAHRHAVVHRDLKPSNVLVDLEGRVRLLDFGIAKVLKDSADAGDRDARTRVNERPGTLLYAAPEQLQGDEISVATDIYSLGVILFELLCGVSPYGDAAARSPSELEAAVTHLPPPRPSQAADEAFAVNCAGAANLTQWRAALRGDLDNIVLKALQKKPLERYGSVERFLDDLQRFIEHRPVAARRPPLLHRLKLVMRRNLAATAASAVGVAAALLLTTLAVSQYRVGVAERLRAEMVRDFMFDLVGDAEPDDRRTTGEPTGSEMVQTAVKRAETRFSAQPRMLGELLAELARMRVRLRESGATEPEREPGPDPLVVLQRRAVSLLEHHAPAGDAALNKSRTYLADSLIKERQLDDADGLAREVLEACARGVGCAKARFYARNELSRIEMLHGHPAVALEHMGRAVTESEAGFGPHDSETSLALLAYATTARQAGQFELARASLDRALALSERLKLKRADRQAMHLMRAVVDMDMGRYAEAQGRLESALSGGRMEDPLRFRFLRVLATVQLAQGAAGAALATADTVLASAPDGLDATLARQARARARGMLGACAEATDDMTAALQGLRALGYAERSMEIMRARRFAAEIEWRACAPAQGRASMLLLAREQAALKGGQEIEFAQTLDLLGAAQLGRGETAAALQAHRQAGAELKERLPGSHPLRERNRELLFAAETAHQAAPRQASSFQPEK